jgi:GNAT superfamily N-acetyltransferase
MDYEIKNIKRLTEHHNLAAEWSLNAWQHLFPKDTLQTYFDIFTQSGEYEGRLSEIFVAINNKNELLGLSGLLDDDELPDSKEPGPWLAAVYVTPHARRYGIGSALVKHATDRAFELGYSELFLFTEDMQNWYSKTGWNELRTTTIQHETVHVMRLALR